MRDEDEIKGNAWGRRFSQNLFNMTSSSGLFRTHSQLLERGAESDGPNWHLNESTYVPLYDLHSARWSNGHPSISSWEQDKPVGSVLG